MTKACHRKTSRRAIKRPKVTKVTRFSGVRFPTGFGTQCDQACYHSRALSAEELADTPCSYQPTPPHTRGVPLYVAQHTAAPPLADLNFEVSQAQRHLILSPWERAAPIAISCVFLVLLRTSGLRGVSQRGLDDLRFSRAC